jgi:YcxB-like protein
VEITGQVLMTRPFYRRLVRSGVRRQILFFWIGGAVLLVVGVLNAALVRGGQIVNVGVIAGLALLLAPYLMIRSAERRLGLGEGQVWTYRVSPDGAGQTNPIAGISVPWHSVTRTTETAQAWRLRLRTGGVLLLPKDAFDPAQLPGVAELVRTCGPVAKR